MSLPPFECVINDHGTAVLRVLRGVVGTADADDCWQDTFIAALRAYPQLRDDSNVRAWLVTIAHRKAIDLLRSRGRGAVPVAEVPEPGRADGQGRSGDADAAAMDAVLDGVVGAHLWSRVGSLPDKQRLAVAYRYGADLDYEEIGLLLGCSRDAARRNTFEGIRRLRAQLSTSGETT